MTTSATHPSGGTWVPEITFAARLALVRNRMGWNAKEAALACGFPPQSWRNWEAGVQPHDYIGVCRKIHERTGCDLEFLAIGPKATSAPLPRVPFGSEGDGNLTTGRYALDSLPLGEVAA